MLKKDLVFLLALVVILFGIYWKTFNYDLIWDDEMYFKHNILFIENHPISSAFKFGYFSEQLGVQGQDHYYRPAPDGVVSFWRTKLWGIQNVTLRLTNLLIYLFGLIFLLFLPEEADGVSILPRDRHAALCALPPEHGQHRLGGRPGRPADVSLGDALFSLSRPLPKETPEHFYLWLSAASFLPGNSLQGNVPVFLPGPHHL